MKNRALTVTLIGTQLLAFWPVWRWYLLRITDGSDEPYGIAALLIAVGFCAFHLKEIKLTPPLVRVSAALTIIYCATYAIVPPLVRGVIALAALGSLLSSCTTRHRLSLSLLALLILSLPLIASLQFYLGYPVRLLTTHITSVLVSGTGFPVSAEGTHLVWRGEVVAIDAPCSGIKMLWSGLVLNFALALFTNLNSWLTWVSYSISSIIIFLGNLFRTFCLFYTESKIFDLPAWTHSGIGLLAFVMVAFMIVQFHLLLSRRGVSCCL